MYDSFGKTLDSELFPIQYVLQNGKKFTHIEELCPSLFGSIPNTTSETKSVIGQNPRRKKIVALILVFTPLGGLGFHRFYTGHYNYNLYWITAGVEPRC